MKEVDVFAAQFRLLGQSEHTLEVYLGVLRRLEKSVELATVTPFDLTAYLTERSQNVAPGTLAVDIRALRCFYRWRSSTVGGDDPSRFLKLPKIAEPEVESCSMETYMRLMSSIPAQGFWNCRDRAIIAVLWSSGARLGELSRMQKADLDLAAGTFNIPRAKSRRPRVVGLTPEAVKAVKQYLKHSQSPGPWLWKGTQGPLGHEGIKQMLERRSKAAGVHVTAHQFRRGVAERWLAAGGSETLLRYHAGWESTAMVRRYIRKNGERLAIEEHRRLLG